MCNSSYQSHAPWERSKNVPRPLRAALRLRSQRPSDLAAVLLQPCTAAARRDKPLTCMAAAGKGQVLT
eukprot:364103-Chlamydomonas_euryale.AAC.1